MRSARAERAERPCHNVTYHSHVYRCGDRLLAVTKEWLAANGTSALLHRPTFETCLETGALHHPSNVALKAARIQAQQARCRRVKELPVLPGATWVALDCEDYGRRPRPSDGNMTHHFRSTPLALCAPPHVAVACLSCSAQHLRPGLDMGLPPIMPRLKQMQSHPLFPASRDAVEQRCRAHQDDPLRLAASFRGTAKHGAAVKKLLRLRLAKELHGRETTPMLGPISVHLNDVGDQGQPVHGGVLRSMEEDLSHSQFGLVPRGDSYYSYRFVETLSFGVAPVIVADDWVLPFEEIIDWRRIALRVPERDLGSLPQRLAVLPLSEICAMRVRAFEVYHAYLQSPARWNDAFGVILEARRRRASN